MVLETVFATATGTLVLRDVLVTGVTDDPRDLATIDAIADRLTDSRGLVYRYRTGADATGDGLAGDEGTFLLCTFWLAQALAASG